MAEFPGIPSRPLRRLLLSANDKRNFCAPERGCIKHKHVGYEWEHSAALVCSKDALSRNHRFAVVARAL